VRARMPVGAGMWPAFWMLGADIDLRGWPNAGEIDVVEHIGRQPRVVHGTVHGPTYSGGDSIGGSHTFPDALPSDAFHTYAVEWEPGRIEWWVDDVHYGTLLPGLLPKAERWVFDRPMFMILNLAVGGQWPGEPTEATTFPQEFAVDHVRVYAREATDG
jgi:beta-glucanase (GH16 family)